MDHPSWTLVALGLVFFAAYVLKATVLTWTATTRADRLEAMGAAVPGLGGLCLTGMGFWPYPVLVIGLGAVAILTFTVGRGLYEEVVFRRWTKE